MTGPRFDPTINLGHIITLGGVVIAIAGGWYVADYRLASLELQVKNLGAIVIDSARLDERVKEHDRRLQRLELK